MPLTQSGKLKHDRERQLLPSNVARRRVSDDMPANVTPDINRKWQPNLFSKPSLKLPSLNFRLEFKRSSRKARLAYFPPRTRGRYIALRVATSSQRNKNYWEAESEVTQAAGPRSNPAEHSVLTVRIVWNKCAFVISSTTTSIAQIGIITSLARMGIA